MGGSVGRKSTGSRRRSRPTGRSRASEWGVAIGRKGDRGQKGQTQGGRVYVCEGSLRICYTFLLNDLVSVVGTHSEGRTHRMGIVNTSHRVLQRGCRRKESV